MSIVVIGTVFVDIKGFPFETYFPTGRNAGNVEFCNGGVGHNVAVDIANVGIDSTLLTLVDDSTGGQVLRDLKEHKVNTEYIREVPNGTGMWLAVFDHNGELAGSISKRPVMDEVRTILDEKGDEIFRKADSIVLEFDTDREINERVFHYAKKYHKKVFGLVSNMTIAAQMRDLLENVDCFVCNEEEAGILFFDDFTIQDPETLADMLASRIEKAHIPAMVVTLGSKGAVYASMEGERGHFPAQKVNVRDTTGAGDAFCAGMSIGLTYGKSLREAVEIGTRLASSVITVQDSTCPKFRPEEFDL